MDLQLGITHSYHSNSNLLLPPMELQHLFDKVVTPSDVGKLNRLVIPKQYAEKYFPLNPFVAERGTQLAFEEQDDHSTVITTGAKPKQWLFRYLYWSSSQSYVITKGWSRFVKEKRLDAGDTISFCRGYGGRLFIGWQRRRVLLPEAAVTYPCIDFRAAVPAVQIKPKRIRLFGVNLECFDQPKNGSGKVQKVVTVSTPESSVRWWIRNRQPAFIGLGFE